MERRFEVRKQEMLAECEVWPQVIRGVEERMQAFVKPFADLLGAGQLNLPQFPVLIGRGGWPTRVRIGANSQR